MRRSGSWLVGVCCVASGVTEAQARDSAQGRVRAVEEKGFVFHPSVQRAMALRFAIGINYDAIDPAVLASVNANAPQLTVDVRVGSGRGWSVKGHLNSKLLSSELLLGVSYAWRVGSWSLEGTFGAGAYLGTQHELDFDVLFLWCEYRPELSVGQAFGSMAISARGTLILMGPQSMQLGGATGQFDDSDALVGHSEMLLVENTTGSNAVWYFGAGAMTARAHYSYFLPFADAPGFYTYPRLVAGYEF
jgi:hypothetical protein